MLGLASAAAGDRSSVDMKARYQVRRRGCGRARTARVVLRPALGRRRHVLSRLLTSPAL